MAELPQALLVPCPWLCAGFAYSLRCDAGGAVLCILPKGAGGENPLQEPLLHFTVPSHFTSPCSLGISVGRALSPSQEQRCCLGLLR